MKLSKLILLVALSIITSPLHAQYPEFNVGNGCLKHSTLSPDRKFLLVPGNSPASTKLYNLETGELHGKLKSLCSMPFFSQDSKFIFAAAKKAIHRHEITENGVMKLSSVPLRSRDFDTRGAYKQCYMHINNTFISLCLKSNRNVVFFYKVLESNNEVIIQEFDIDFFIHAAKACTLSRDSNIAVIACTKSTSFCNPSYIHIINLEDKKILSNYRLNIQTIYSVNFSPDQKKLIFTASINRLRSGWSDCFIILDLETNQSSWFEQEQEAQFADFINDSTILMILEDGSVRYQELTEANLTQHKVTNKREFKVLKGPLAL